MTVEEWFEQTWPSAVRGLGRGTSKASIEHTVKLSRPFVRTFGRWQLETVAEHPVACAQWARAHPSSVRYARTILADAVLLGQLTETPLAQVRVQHERTGRGDFFPTRAEVDALAEAGRKWGLREWVLTGAWSGGRLSALAGLGARDVEPAPGGVLRVNYRRKRHPGKYPAVLLQPGADALALVLPATGLVFRRPKGAAWDVRTISERWVKMRRELELPETCTSHCLRRFYATHLIDQGVSETDVALALDHVDERGHPNVDLVRRIYTRPDRDAALARIAEAA